MERASLILAIAESELKQKDPQALTQTIAILNENPEFERLWKSQLTQVDPSERDRVLFMLAATATRDTPTRVNLPCQSSRWHLLRENVSFS